MTMKSSQTMQCLVLLLCNICMLQVVIATFCDGEREYVDVHGDCQICEQCGPGFQPSSYHCGWGTKDASYKCVPCDEGTYSTGFDYQYCKVCSPCHNSEVVLQCTPTQNAECGACHSGYFRPVTSDEKLDRECHKCMDNSNNPQCKQDPIVWIAIGVGIGVVIVFILVLACCCYCVRRMKTGHASKQAEPSKLGYILKCTNNEDTVNSTSLQPLTVEDGAVVEEGSSGDLREQPQLGQIFVTHLNPNVGHEGMSSYAHRVTATFPQTQQLPSNYSQQATAAFDDIENQLTGRGAALQVALPDSPQSSRADIHVEHFDTDQIGIATQSGDYNDVEARSMERKMPITVPCQR